MTQNNKQTDNYTQDIADNIIKVILTLWVCFVASYMVHKYVGKDNLLSPDLVWGWIQGSASTVMAVYFKEKFKQSKENSNNARK